MKKRYLIVVGIAAALFLWCAIPASAAVDIGFFYQELSPYGEWVQVRYGWGWVPWDVSPGWRPYTTGRWVYTEDGPLWASDEEWGWIPFHYGRWYFDGFHGWVWIPGGEWAPAWVVWRYGGGYLGWAPLTPEVGWSYSSGLVWGRTSFDAFDPYSWCFVPARSFFAPSIIRVVVPPPRNIHIIRQTRNMTRYVVDRDRVVDRSFDRENLSRFVGRQVSPLRMDELRERNRGRDLEVREREKDVRVYRPRVTMNREKGPSPGQMQAPPRAKRRAIEKDEELLRERMRNDRLELEREHQRELQSPPPSVGRDDLRRRQQEEMKYFEQYYQRENRRLEERRKPGRGQEKKLD
jgi:hypothetical protein